MFLFLMFVDDADVWSNTLVQKQKTLDGLMKYKVPVVAP